MRLLKKMLLTVTLIALPAASFGCSSEPDEAGLAEMQTATVQYSDIALEITAAGNLDLSKTEDLAVDIFYSEGTIGEVLVEAGDTVTEGQVLVRLDTDEWTDEMSTLEDAVTTKERALLDAQIALIQSEQSLASTRDSSSLEKAVITAQIALDNAKSDLTTGIAAADYETAEADLRKAQIWYDYVVKSLQSIGGDADDWLLKLEAAKENLEAAETIYNNVLSGYDSNEIAIKKMAVEVAEINLAAAEKDLADYDQDVALAEMQLERKQGSVADAEKALADAQANLEEAQSKSPEITAPFAGFITSVNVEGGDEVLNGTVAVQIADPDQFKAEILVSEMDISQVEIGDTAWIVPDAMSDLTLPAKVTHISPTATISSGVVNYTVKVELLSQEEIEEQMQAAMEQVQAQLQADIAAGVLPPPLQAAVEAGEMTQEEAEAMFEDMQAAGLPAGANAGQMTAADYELREGLTVTVTIVVDEATNVLVVPYAAVTTMGGQSTVQVVTASGETEQRTVETGVTDYEFIEVTGGLSEGEEVIVPQGVALTATATSQQGPPGGGMMMFGGPPR